MSRDIRAAFLYLFIFYPNLHSIDSQSLTRHFRQNPINHLQSICNLFLCQPAISQKQNRILPLRILTDVIL